MSTSPLASQLFRQSHRAVSRTFAARSSQVYRFQARSPRLAFRQHQVPARSLAAATRCLSTSSRSYAGLMPDTHDPQPPETEDEHRATQATEITDDEYQQLSDEYMEAVYERAEQVQEGREDVEVEFSAGVLTIAYPPNGTYVINKQPPNKQIWLSSPLTGPKRYDWVVDGESMHHKEGGGQGDWVYLRDGSTLSSLLNKELGLDIGVHEDPLEVSKDPTE